MKLSPEGASWEAHCLRQLKVELEARGRLGHPLTPDCLCETRPKEHFSLFPGSLLCLLFFLTDWPGPPPPCPSGLSLSFFFSSFSVLLRRIRLLSTAAQSMKSGVGGLVSGLTESHSGPSTYPSLMENSSLNRAGAQRQGSGGCGGWNWPSILAACPCSGSLYKSTAVRLGSKMKLISSQSWKLPALPGNTA